ncbi:MAG: hypothetical protein ACP5UR_01455 [Chloroflexus sp.]
MQSHVTGWSLFSGNREVAAPAHPLCGVGCDTVLVDPRDPLFGDGLGSRG